MPEEHKGVICLRPINISPYIPAPKLGETYHYATQNVPGRKGLGRALKLEQCNERETCAGKMLEAAPLPMMKIIMRWFFYYKSRADFPPYTRPMDHFNAFCLEPCQYTFTPLLNCLVQPSQSQRKPSGQKRGFQDYYVAYAMDPCHVGAASGFL